MSELETVEKPAKANIQGFEIHLVKKTIMGRCHPRQKSGVISIGGASALPTNPKKGYAHKLANIIVDRSIDALAVDRNMHERMTPDEP